MVRWRDCTEASMSMKLAEILNVKHSWLMLGTAHGESGRRAIARRHTPLHTP